LIRIASLLLLLLFLPTVVEAQIVYAVIDKVPPVYSSQYHIKELKRCTLLVRLQTKENHINYFKNQKDFSAVERIKKHQSKVNEALKLAFSNFFDFTQVAYFYSSDSKKVAEGNFHNVLLNENLERDSTIQFTDTNYYIVDVSEVFYETYQEHMQGLVILDKYFQQLQKPFPYHVRRRAGMSFIKREDADLVRIFNENLHAFYGK